MSSSQIKSIIVPRTKKDLRLGIERWKEGGNWSMRAEGRKLNAVRNGKGANIKREQAWRDLVPAAGIDNREKKFKGSEWIELECNQTAIS